MDYRVTIVIDGCEKTNRRVWVPYNRSTFTVRRRIGKVERRTLSTQIPNTKSVTSFSTDETYTVTPLVAEEAKMCSTCLFQATEVISESPPGPFVSAGVRAPSFARSQIKTYISERVV